MTDLKIYRHVRAQATVKVMVGEKEEMIKFRDGRVVSNADEETLNVLGGRYHTTKEDIQKAIEARKDYGKLIFAEHKIEQGVEAPPPADKDYRVFEGDTINAVKNTLKEEFPETVQGSDLRSPVEMLRFCKKVGVAFPEFFKEQEHFKSSLLKDVVVEDVTFPEGEKGDAEETQENKTPPNDITEDQGDEIEIDREELVKLKRDELDQFAVELGVNSPETLPNKGSVIDEIEKLAE